MLFLVTKMDKTCEMDINFRKNSLQICILSVLSFFCIFNVAHSIELISGHNISHNTNSLSNLNNVENDKKLNIRTDLKVHNF